MEHLDLVMNSLLTVLQDFGLAAVPAVGFAMIFNVPKPALKYCAVAGAIGHALRFSLYKIGPLPVEWATLIAACIVSVIGIHWAQKWRAHPKVFTVAAMIPMIPGVYAFTALLAAVEIERKGFSPELLKTALDNGLKAFFIVAALAVGLALPGLLFYRRRPVV
ncbi:MAG: threonine/serine exporter family protein [Verrucomicrobia bacterium]|nr:threonine/serine exporter family protein [Verrucomicrobiota bacterium]